MLLRAALPLSLLAALALVAGSTAQPRSYEAAVGKDVRLELARAGQARVIVALQLPVRFPARSPAALVASTRAIRELVLERLGPRSGFRPTARWDTVAAVPGVVDAASLARLTRDPDVVRIDLDAGGQGGDDESLPLVRGDVAHAAGFTGRGVAIAVLDSGVDRTHPDIADALVGEQCFVFPNGCPNGAAEQAGAGSAADDHGHGTNVAGIVASNGTVAPIGVAPEAFVVAVKVLDRNNAFQTTSQIVSALNWIAVNRPDVRVVNMSLGTSQLFTGNCDNANAGTLALASAVSALRARGVAIFASSLNDASPTTMSAPACISGVIAVGAVYDSALGPFSFETVCSHPVTAADQIACFSNSGTELDLLAPGARITSAGLRGGVSTFGGTSQASPHAAVAAALLLQRDSTLSPDAIETTLETTGLRITDTRNGITTPRLDIAAALQLQPSPAPAADVAVARRTLDFRRVPVGVRKVLSLTVANVGTASLTVTSTARRPFSVSSRQPLTVQPGKAGAVKIVFAPGAARLYRQTLILRTNDPDEGRVTITLRGGDARR